MVGKGEPLDVVIEIIPQPSHNPLRCLCSQSTAEECKQSLQNCQTDEPYGDNGKKVSDVFINQDIIHKGADKEIGPCSQQSGYSKTQGGEEIDCPESFEQPPQTLKTVEAYNLLQIRLIALLNNRHLSTLARR